jgi:hypothetical protein
MNNNIRGKEFINMAHIALIKNFFQDSGSNNLVPVGGHRSSPLNSEYRSVVFISSSVLTVGSEEMYECETPFHKLFGSSKKDFIDSGVHLAVIWRLSLLFVAGKLDFP